MKRYKPLFESEQLSITDNEDKRGMFNLTLKDESGQTLSELTYSKNPNISYTSDKNPEDYIFIEWITTPTHYRNKGYATQLIDHLSKKYKHKIILASTNDLSSNIVKKYKIIEL